MCPLNSPVPNLSPSTIDLLGTLDAESRGRLQRRDDFGVLLDLGSSPDRASALEELAFRAKFLTRTFRIMQRIGREGTGYDRLETEFAASMDVARGHMRTLLGEAPEDVRERFASSYFSMSPAGLGNLMALMGDLTWYKNWLLDSRHGRA
jgi:hypothetical protein